MSRLPTAKNSPGQITPEIAKVRRYMQKAFSNKEIEIDMPERTGQAITVRVADNFLGTLNRDEDEGEVSYSFTMVIIAEDLE